MNILKYPKLKFFGFFLGIIFLNAEGAPSKLCEEVRMRRDGAYIIGASYNEYGIWDTDEFDFDGDGYNDHMSLQCDQGSSFVPADPCHLSITLRGSAPIKFSASRIYLDVFEGHPYFVASEPDEANGQMRLRSKVYRIAEGEMKCLCSAATIIIKR